MEESNKILNLISYKLCKQKLKIINKPLIGATQTGFWMHPIFGYSYIQLNIFELELNLVLLIERNYTPDHILLEALLHEIGHVKQWKKFKKRKWGIFKRFRWYKSYKQNDDYMEKVADRYAHYVSKIILKETGLWKNISDIN